MKAILAKLDPPPPRPEPLPADAGLRYVACGACGGRHVDMVVTEIERC